MGMKNAAETTSESINTAISAGKTGAEVEDQRSPQHTADSAVQRWTFLAIVSLGLFLIAVDNSVLFTALPVLREQLHTTELQGLWIINAYPLVLSGLLLGTGTLGDRVGHRHMFLVGLVIFGIASACAAFAPNAWMLVAARAFLGLGAAAMMPATLALIRTTFPDPRELATAIGIWAATATTGAAAGPVIGGFLLEHYWWGSIFLINIPVAIIAIIGTAAIAPPNAPNPEKKWDLLSSFYAMLVMFGFVLLIKELAAHRQPLMLTTALALGIIGAVAFQRRQARAAEPLLDFGIFRERMFSGGVIAASFGMFTLGGVELMSTQRFQMAAGYSPLQGGLLVAAIAVSSIPFAISGGALLHKLGFRTLITGGFLIITLGIAAIYAGVSAANYLVLFLGLFLIGAGAGCTMSVSSTAIIGSAPQSRSGMASALEEVSYEFGSLISVAITGSLLPAFFAASLPDGISTSLADAFANPSLADAASTAMDRAYLAILVILAAFAVVAAAMTAIAFRGNPKKTLYAHE